MPKVGIRKLAILNRDDECSYSYIRERLEVASVDYGLRMSTNYQGENVRVVEVFRFGAWGALSSVRRNDGDATIGKPPLQWRTATVRDIVSRIPERQQYIQRPVFLWCLCSCQ